MSDEATTPSIRDSSAVPPSNLATNPFPAPLHGGVYASDNASLIAGRDIIGGDVNIKIVYREKSDTYQGETPYVGLDAFDEKHAQYFFGREELIAQLAQRVQTASCIFVTGASGSGKSSLVHAGMFHALESSQSQGKTRWVPIRMTPGNAPFADLGRVTALLGAPSNAQVEIETQGRENPSIFASWVNIVRVGNPDLRALVFIDQFEELFSPANDSNTQRAFIELVLTALQKLPDGLRVVIAMRSDFIGAIGNYPELNALLNQQFIQVGAMAPSELERAIEGPANLIGWEVEPALTRKIIDDMNDAPNALPLMQFVLQDLFNYERNLGTHALTLQGYLARGGMRGALERHASDVLNSTSADEKILARTIFSGLISIGTDGKITRREAYVKDLSASVALIEPLVQKLAQARLITIYAYRDDPRQRITLIHESLIQEWSWLAQLARDNQDGIRIGNKIADDARNWDEHARNASYLYHDDELTEAQARIRTNQIILSGAALEFMNASAELERQAKAREAARQHQELAAARTAKRLWQSIAGLVGVLLLAALVVLARPYVLSWFARGETVPIAGGTFSPGANYPPDPTLMLPDYSQHAPWQITLGNFALDRYEVSTAQYKLCYDVNACTRPPNLTDWDNPAKQQHPMTNVYLEQADAFCRWIGRRLPTELEWEWAARTANDYRFPTGNEIPTAQSVNVMSLNSSYQPTDTRAVDDLADEVNHTKGMTGNVREWTISYWFKYSDSKSYQVYWPQSVAVLAPNQPVIVRGSSWRTGLNLAQSVSREPVDSDQAQNNLGFRCLEGPPPDQLIKEVK